MKNNKPEHAAYDAGQNDKIEYLPDAEFYEEIEKLLKENRDAYLDLAK